MRRVPLKLATCHSQPLSLDTTFHIAVRFLFAKRRAMLMSLSGIVFGVGLFIITQAQTAGFEHFFTRTALATDGSLHVEDRIQDTIASMTIESESGGNADAVSLGKERKYIEGVQFPEQIRDALLQFNNVAGVSPVLRGSVELDSNFRQQPTQIFGVNLDDFLAVSDLARQIIFGQLDNFRNDQKGVLIGSRLANRANLAVGDPVVLRQAGRSDRYRVAAIFESGIEQVDRERVIVHLP